MAQHAEIFGTLLAADFGIPKADALDHYRQTAGEPLAVQIRKALSPTIEVTHTEIESIAAHFVAILCQQRPIPFPEVPKAIRWLKEAGFKLAVTSGGPPALVETKLRLSGLQKYFGLALGTEISRPSMVKGPAHFIIIREHFGLSVDEFKRRGAMIGDTPHDMQLAKSEGLLAIGRRGWCEAVDLLNAGADIVIKSLEDVVALLNVRPSH
jgi:phosphoglycolate phosphatase-like HAD superfamily hydrolase